MSRCLRTTAAGNGAPDRWPRSYGPAANAGFTVIELILVIVIVAVLGAIAGPRFFDNATFDERAYYDEVVASLRYAQKVAVATGCRVRVDITATTYSLMQQSSLSGHCDPADASFPTPVVLGTGEVMNGSAPNGVTTTPAIAFDYEPLGRTSLAADQSVSVGSRTLTIQADSGLVVAP